jgi:aminoglycoside 3'-phosphotransferase II
VRVPPSLRDQLAGFTFERVALGEVAETYRLTRRDGSVRYLKIADDLERERMRLAWAADRLPVPRVIAFASESDRQYLVLEALAGTPIELATDLGVSDRVAHLARTMRALHDVPIASCPFDGRIAERLAQAEANVRAGRVDESDFDAERIGRSAASILDELRAWPAFSEDLVVTHGDFTLANILIEPTGIVDLGRLGVADRYQDIALVLRDIAGDYGPAWVDAFAEAYGLTALVDSKRRFFCLLDELF